MKARPGTGGQRIDRAAAAALVAAGAAFVSAAVPDSPTPPAPPAAANLMFTAATVGNATICGCRGARAGGIARRVHLMKTWDAVSKGPAVWVDGGSSLTFASPQEIETDALILEEMRRMGYSAVTVSGLDLDPQVGFFDRTLGAAELPFLSANLTYHDTGLAPWPAWKSLVVPAAAGAADQRPIRIGVIGVTAGLAWNTAAGSRGRTLIASDPVEAVRKIYLEVRAASDLVIVTTSADENVMASLAASVPGIDLILSAVEHRAWDAPRTFGTTTALLAGDRGREVVRVAIRRTGTVVRFDLERIRLAEGEMPEDPETAARVGAALDRFNEESRSLMTAHAEKTPGPPIAPWVGAVSCVPCHAEANTVWTGSSHAHALETLKAVKRDYTRTCVLCHVTGWDNPEGGGFKDPATTPQLVDVQCEACHGPAADHIADPSAPYGVVKVPERCQNCHDKANSAEFEYTSYWKKIAH